MSSSYALISPTTRADYRDAISHVSESVWPEFMLHDPVAGQHWDGLFDSFPSYQFALIDEATQAIVGIANSVPLAWNKPLEDLPAEGWDWQLVKSAEDAASGKQPSLMGALQIAVAPPFQRRGLSGRFLQEMRHLAQQKGFTTLVAPVRPSGKHLYPLSPIEGYASWIREDGLPFDPWLRVHVRGGGRILKTCPSAMHIPGTISEWGEWTGLRFFHSGPYIVPGALVPVEIDLARDKGTYTEPGVWVVHEIPHG